MNLENDISIAIKNWGSTKALVDNKTIELWGDIVPEIVIEIYKGFFGNLIIEKLQKYLKLAKDIKLLESLYNFNDSIEVKNFLLKHDYLIKNLFDAHRQIKGVFREHALEVCLEFNRDPEENYEGLFIIIKTNLAPQQALELLDKLDNKWWLNVDSEVRKLLEMDIKNIS